MKTIASLFLICSAMLINGTADAQSSVSAATERGSQSAKTQSESRTKSAGRRVTRTVSVNAAILDAYMQNFELKRWYSPPESLRPPKPPLPACVANIKTGDSPENRECLRKVAQASFPPKSTPEQIAKYEEELADYQQRRPGGTEVQLFVNKLPEWRVLTDPLAGFPAQASGGKMPLREARRVFNGTALNYSDQFNQRDPAVENYLLAIAFAHFVTSDAAQILEQRGVAESPQAAAQAAIEAVDVPGAAQRAGQLVQQVRICSGTYPRIDVNGGIAGDLALRCGPIQVDANSRQYLINGRPTLSQEAIDGRRIEIALTDDANRASTAEQSRGSFTKKSSSSQRSAQVR